jgi:ubiquinol-cytochrome c reductase core subunit 2
MSQKAFLASTEAMAVNSAHGLAFHHGLGVPVSPASSTPIAKYLSPEAIGSYSAAAYAKPNFAVVANGADHAELTKWVGEFFKDFSQPAIQGLPALESPQSKYYGGEERIAHGNGNTMVLAFPGSSSFTGGSYKPEVQVLAALLGGETNIKWSPGFSLLSKAASEFPGADVKTKSAIYSDAGLLTVTINGAAGEVRKAAEAAVKTLKAVAAGEISKEDIKKAIATSKFKELEFGENVDAGIELTGSGLVSGGKAYQMDEVAKAIDSVSEEQVKTVSEDSRNPFHYSYLAHIVSAGREDNSREQGVGVGCWRSVRASMGGGAGLECVNSRKGDVVWFERRMYRYGNLEAFCVDNLSTVHCPNHTASAG